MSHGEEGGESILGGAHNTCNGLEVMKQIKVKEAGSPGKFLCGVVNGRRSEEGRRCSREEGRCAG